MSVYKKKGIEKMVKVSVIVTVYNGEKYLKQCLDSVCNQTLRDIEIICVDDGSTDSSPLILKEYQQKDDRIQIYRQQNLYAGVARNTGKSHASGEYIIFWDCDDFFVLDALEKLYAKAVETKADVVVCGVYQYLEEKGLQFYNTANMNVKRIPEEDVFNRQTNESYILNFTNEAAWNKLFRRAFVEDQKLAFQPVRNGNDLYFTVSALCLAERITTLAEPLITYRKNQKQSLVGTLSKAPTTPFQAWMDVAENLEEKGVMPEQSYVNKVIGSTIYLLRNISQREAFLSTVAFLQNGGLARLHICERDENYYYISWYADFVSHILKDSPEDFQTYLAFMTYIQLTERTGEKKIKESNLKEARQEIRNVRQQVRNANQQIKKMTKELTVLQKKYEDLENSVSYKMGRTLTWLPRKIKDLSGDK